MQGLQHDIAIRPACLQGLQTGNTIQPLTPESKTLRATEMEEGGVSSPLLLPPAVPLCWDESPDEAGLRDVSLRAHFNQPR